MMAAFDILAFGACSFVAVAGALGMATTMSMFRSGIFLMASFIGVAGLFILLSADLIGLLQVMMYIGGFLVMILFMVLVMHDPGGAMMAGMELSPLERWFSKGLVPRDEATSAGQDDPASGEGRSHAGNRHEGHAMPHGEGRHGHARDHGGGAMPHGAHGGHAEHRHADHQHGDGGHGEMDMSMVTPVRPLAAWLAAAAGVVLVGMLFLRPAWPVTDAVPDPDSARRVGNLLMDKYMVAFEGAGFLILIGIFGAVLLARPSTHPDDPSRAAKAAVDAKPEAIRDDRLAPLAEAGGAPEPEHHGSHHGHEDHVG
ncbi:NADH-quinone oxidoreductase subunit J family protein [Methylobacterium aquaticum]|nr:NADH-quinone oxidoreductase subunit J [Methylobacterium aquaticum]